MSDHPTYSRSAPGILGYSDKPGITITSFATNTAAMNQGDRLRHELRAAGMTQVKLAELVGRRPDQVSRWCAGKVPIPAYVWTVIRLSQQLSQVRAALGVAEESRRRRRAVH